MFGFVTADVKKLTRPQQDRYAAVYCGICRGIRGCAGQPARLALSYDMAFLALLLMSLYEPEEHRGNRACLLHPCRKSGYVENAFVAYAAQMNVALAWYKAKDDVTDDGRLSARAVAELLKKSLPELCRQWPRQTAAMEHCIRELSRLEKENCPNPDLPAACFGRLMGELMVYKEDLWAPHLRQLGMALGRFIYLADAAVDYRRDRKKGKYNPFLAAGMEEDWKRWEEYLVLAMGRCAEHFEALPLVQDKELLNNILYAGVWTSFKKTEEEGHGSV